MWAHCDSSRYSAAAASCDRSSGSEMCRPAHGRRRWLRRRWSHQRCRQHRPGRCRRCPAADSAAAGPAVPSAPRCTAGRPSWSCPHRRRRCRPDSAATNLEWNQIDQTQTVRLMRTYTCVHLLCCCECVRVCHYEYIVVPPYSYDLCMHCNAYTNTKKLHIFIRS